MANGAEKNNDFYAVLGLNKECTPTELRTAYKKLALRWHPDRCSASGNSKFVEEAKKKFQAIQQAYSVLSDANKRFLYDVGAYDSDDDENGMGDFLNEMAVMMSQTKSRENGEESFEELQELFEEMFQAHIDSFGCSGQPTTSCSAASSFASYGESSSSNKRNSSGISSEETRVESNSSFDAQFHGFCLGTGGAQARYQARERSQRRNARSSRR
ncbi:dnaJ homolog subfamily B member 6-like isoform X2 [Durio zibethinus]|uniref:DnaJ homolog subfamily B member 6-like isoform X2 n=1 Tax=Durio zibethinus TaxID=66656 RepID=A0A6P5WGW2_DURZI|nr:dnaJ homolog subfamily B member 6-like isoform X2 [Durio zibethinus]